MSKRKSVVIKITMWIVLVMSIITVSKMYSCYTITGTITKVRDNNTVVIVDPSFNQWEIVDNGSYNVGDNVKVVFFNNFTDTDKTDDIVKKVIIK